MAEKFTEDSTRVSELYSVKKISCRKYANLSGAACSRLVLKTEVKGGKNNEPEHNTLYQNLYTHVFSFSRQ